MTKRGFVIIKSLIILAISVFLLLIFIYFTKKPNTVEKNINISVKNISLNVGEEKYNFYSINNDKASVSFEVNKEGIIEINHEKIIALNAGEVTVTITANLNNFTTEKSFTVKVYANNYSYSIVPVQGCSVENNNIFKTQEVCQINIIFKDKLNQDIEVAAYISPLYSDKIIYEFGQYQIITYEDCEIKIFYPEINFNVLLKINNIKTA